MDENKSPQDFLNEIFEKSQAAPSPPQPRFEPPGDDPPPASPPDGPAEKHGTETGPADIPDNPEQTEQYQAYCRELLDRGWLQGPSSSTSG